MQPMTILDPCEREIVHAVALYRFNRVNDHGLGAGRGESGNTVQRHFVGALGEMIFAKTFGHYWAGDCNAWAKGDFSGLEIRATTHEQGSLIVFPNDGDKKCVLVYVNTVNYSGEVRGWFAASDARCNQYLPPEGKLRPGSPTQWWVPQSRLRKDAL
jgi:hypothetical protein